MPMPPDVRQLLDDLAQDPNAPGGQGVRRPGDEAEFQRRAAAILQHPQFRKALDDAYDNPGDRAELERDAKGYFVRKGAPIPDDARIESYTGSYCVRICFLWWCTGWVCI